MHLRHRRDTLNHAGCGRGLPRVWPRLIGWPVAWLSDVAWLTEYVRIRMSWSQPAAPLPPPTPPPLASGLVCPPRCLPRCSPGGPCCYRGRPASAECLCLYLAVCSILPLSLVHWALSVVRPPGCVGCCLFIYESSNHTAHYHGGSHISESRGRSRRAQGVQRSSVGTVKSRCVHDVTEMGGENGQ